jgi:hypothetical protein
MPPSNLKSTWGSLLELPDVTALNYPKPPSSPEPPRLPTVEQLFAQGATVAEVPKSKGLFWELFGGDPAALTEHVLEHPDQFTSELTTLVRDLAENRRNKEELTPHEQSLLNTASLTFYQYRPAITSQPKTSTPPAPRSQLVPVDPPARPQAGVDIPADAVHQPYWWE